MFWPCVYRKWAVEGAKVNQKKKSSKTRNITSATYMRTTVI